MKTIKSIIVSKIRKTYCKIIKKKNEILNSQTMLNRKGKFNIFIDKIWLGFKSLIEKLKFRNVNQCNTTLKIEGLEKINCEVFTPYTYCDHHLEEKRRDWKAYHLLDHFVSTHEMNSEAYFKEKALVAINEYILRKQYQCRYNYKRCIRHEQREQILVEYYKEFYTLDGYTITDIQEEYDQNQKEKDEIEKQERKLRKQEKRRKQKRLHKLNNLKLISENLNSNSNSDAESGSSSDSGCDVHKIPKEHPSHSNPELYDAVWDDSIPQSYNINVDDDTSSSGTDDEDDYSSQSDDEDDSSSQSNNDSSDNVPSSNNKDANAQQQPLDPSYYEEEDWGNKINDTFVSNIITPAPPRHIEDW